MKRKRWLAMTMMAGMVIGATGCQDNDVRKYLGKPPPGGTGGGGELFAYLDRLSDAVCQLEEATGGVGIDEKLRICPGGPGDKIKPPTYPP